MELLITFAPYIIITLLVLASGLYMMYLWKTGETVKIYQIIKGLVDLAEKKYGTGTGEIKYDFVASKVYPLIPPFLKFFISAELLDLWIERAVDELQKELEERIEEEDHSK